MPLEQSDADTATLSLRPNQPNLHRFTAGENLLSNYDVGPYTQGVQRGLEIKHTWDLKYLTIHDVKTTSDE